MKLFCNTRRSAIQFQHKDLSLNFPIFQLIHRSKVRLQSTGIFQSQQKIEFSISLRYSFSKMNESKIRSSSDSSSSSSSSSSSISNDFRIGSGSNTIYSEKNEFGIETNSNNNERARANSIILSASAPGTIAQAGERLRNGKLVAFPTETVYGLGANALDEKAVLSIFAAKGRPLTDPVIVHVAERESAKKLIDIHPTLLQVFDHLTRNLWPGPLTIVSKAAPIIPSVCD